MTDHHISIDELASAGKGLVDCPDSHPTVGFLDRPQQLRHPE